MLNKFVGTYPTFNTARENYELIKAMVQK